MEKVRVFGKQYVKFTGNDGQPVEGIKLHCI